MDVGSGVEAAHPLRKMAGNKIMSWDFFMFCLSTKVWDARLYAWIFFYTPLCRMVFLEKPRKVSEKTVFFTTKAPSHGDSKRKNFVTLSLCAFVVEFSDTLYYLKFRYVTSCSAIPASG